MARIAARKRAADDKYQLSTFPFSDGYPWDEGLCRAGRRAVSTHGIWPMRESRAAQMLRAAILARLHPEGFTVLLH